MFARISHELAEREALEQQRQGLLKSKQRLVADNKKRKDDLASLDKDLETFIDVSGASGYVSSGADCIHRPPNLSKRCSRNNIELLRGKPHGEVVGASICCQMIVPKIVSTRRPYSYPAKTLISQHNDTIAVSWPVELEVYRSGT